MKRLIDAIREAGILNTCRGGCEPETEREGNNIALFCISCGWRYQLTAQERTAALSKQHARKIYPRKVYPKKKKKVPKPSGRPPGRHHDIIRDSRIAESYEGGSSVKDIAAAEDISRQGVYDALNRCGLKLRPRLAHV